MKNSFAALAVAAQLAVTFAASAGEPTALELVRGSGTDPGHHVIGSGHVFRGLHPGLAGQLFGDDLGAAHLGLNQHECLYHWVCLRFRCIDSSPQGPNVPQVAGVFRPGTPTQDGEMSDNEPTLAQLGEFGVQGQTGLEDHE